MIGGHPLGNFLFFVAWSSRAVDLFSGLVLLQGEVMKSRRALERLVDLVGGQPSSVVHPAVPVRETQPLVDVGTPSGREPGGAA